jgi:putative transposase
MALKKQKNIALENAIDSLIDSGVDLRTMFQEDGIINQLKRSLLERALQAEMQDHLGYQKYDRVDSNNARNGVVSKTIKTESGEFDIEVPRDRNGTFEPLIVPKRRTRIAGLDDKIVALYAKGMSVADIKEALAELYAGIEISESVISDITDGVIENAKDWQSRALDKIYPVVFIDCIMVKVKQDKRIINKAVYVAIGINISGNKEVLGFWINETEGAKFWLSIFTELKNRGLQDILIMCTDNLTGISESISAAFPKTDHQLCIVHQIRNSLKFVSYKDRKAVVKDLKPIYTAINEDNALSALEAFSQKWKDQYPYIAKSWYANWDNLIGFLKHSAEVRKIIYTTNMIESVNSCFRKVIKNKRSFPSDDSVTKLFFLAIESMTKKWTMPIRDWNIVMSQFMILYEGRL